MTTYKKPPRQIILDMDVTDDQVHGNQEGAFFNTYGSSVCVMQCTGVIRDGTPI